MIFCKVVNPYSSFDTAITGAISLLNGRLYKGLDSGTDIYNLYETGDLKKTAPALSELTGIYEKEFKGSMSDVRFSRCNPGS
jgi:hypothetical protein